MVIIRVNGWDKNLRALAWIAERDVSVKFSADIIYEWHFGESDSGPYTQYREFQFENDVDALEFSLRFS
jgi:hypothetical protein